MSPLISVLPDSLPRSEAAQAAVEGAEHKVRAGGQGGALGELSPSLPMARLSLLPAPPAGQRDFCRRRAGIRPGGSRGPGPAQRPKGPKGQKAKSSSGHPQWGVRREGKGQETRGKATLRARVKETNKHLFISFYS